MTKIKQTSYQLHVKFLKVQYWNHFCSYSDLIILADDTNLFFSHYNIPVLFGTVNNELSKINQWFLVDNVTKTKY